MTKRYAFHLPVGLMEVLREMAAKARRPMTQELIIAIEQYVNNHKTANGHEGVEKHESNI